MEPLNESFDFDQLSQEVRDAFEGGIAERMLLNAGTRLWKWTDFPPQPDKPVSPWWMPLEPEDLTSNARFLSLRALEDHVKSRKGGPRYFLRVPVAVLPEWNEIRQIVIISLKCDRLGFAGNATMQQLNDGENAPIPICLSGSLGQLYIPQLRFSEIQVEDAERELVRMRLDPVFWLSPVENSVKRRLPPKLGKFLNWVTRPRPGRTDG